MAPLLCDLVPSVLADPRLSLLLAAVPAILGSVLLMRSAGVTGAPIILQTGVFLLGGLLLLLLRPLLRTAARSEGERAWALVLAGCLVLTVLPLLWGEAPGPMRWIVVGGVRLYLAAIFLPALVLVLGRIAPDSHEPAVAFGLPVAVASGLLLLQPDAPQATAFALAFAPLWWCWRAAWPAKFVLLALVVGCAVAAWQRPDPLQPVAHVEGVFVLAAGSGPLALCAAVLAALVPAAVLLRQARRSSSVGLLAVALYYLGLLALAPLQLTPIPLLGFGASPILGYLLLAALTPRFGSREAA